LPNWPFGQVIFGASADAQRQPERHDETTPSKERLVMMTAPQNQATTAHQQHNSIDIRPRLSALWIVTMFIYAYVDIFSLMRADFLDALLDGEIINTPLKVSQTFLIFAVVYIAPASLMVYLSLSLRPPANRKANMIVALVYLVTILLSCIGESWLYYLFGSSIEVVLLLMIARLAFCWPTDTPSTVTLAE
jgi:hypothetical protein